MRGLVAVGNPKMTSIAKALLQAGYQQLVAEALVAALAAGNRAYHDDDLIPIGDRHRVEIACRDHVVVNSHNVQPHILVLKVLRKTLIAPLRQERFQSTDLPATFSGIDAYLL